MMRLNKVKGIAIVCFIGVLTSCSNIKNDSKIKVLLRQADEIARHCDSLNKEGVFGALESKSNFLREVVLDTNLLELKIGMKGITSDGFPYLLKNIEGPVIMSSQKEGEIPSTFKEGFTYQISSVSIAKDHNHKEVKAVELQLVSEHAEKVNFSVLYKMN